MPVWGVGWMLGRGCVRGWKSSIWQFSLNISQMYYLHCAHHIDDVASRLFALARRWLLRVSITAPVSIRSWTLPVDLFVSSFALPSFPPAAVASP